MNVPISTQLELVLLSRMLDVIKTTPGLPLARFFEELNRHLSDSCTPLSLSAYWQEQYPGVQSQVAIPPPPKPNPTTEEADGSSSRGGGTAQRGTRPGADSAPALPTTGGAGSSAANLATDSSEDLAILLTTNGAVAGVTSGTALGTAASSSATGTGGAAGTTSSSGNLTQPHPPAPTPAQPSQSQSHAAFPLPPPDTTAHHQAIVPNIPELDHLKTITHQESRHDPLLVVRNLYEVAASGLTKQPSASSPKDRSVLLLTCLMLAMRSGRVSLLLHTTLLLYLYQEDVHMLVHLLPASQSLIKQFHTLCQQVGVKEMEVLEKHTFTGLVAQGMTVVNGKDSTASSSALVLSCGKADHGKYHSICLSSQILTPCLSSQVN